MISYEDKGVLQQFKERLLARFSKPLHIELVVHERHSTVLRLLSKEHDSVRLAMHRMFLQAPDVVLQAVACFVQAGVQKDTHNRRILRAYVHEHFAKNSYTRCMPTLQPLGSYYNLNSVYETLNAKYFNGGLTLGITWYGTRRVSRGSKMILGQYLEGLKLIKIHKRLDSAHVPEYFLHFVVYHEMVHSIVAACWGEKGRLKIHTPAFRQQEKQFTEYEKAKAWERTNLALFFSPISFLSLLVVLQGAC